MKFKLFWSKAYYANGHTTVDAKTAEEALQIGRDNIGGYEGRLNYYPDDDIIEVVEEEK